LNKELCKILFFDKITDVESEKFSLRKIVYFLPIKKYSMKKKFFVHAIVSFPMPNKYKKFSLRFMQ